MQGISEEGGKGIKPNRVRSREDRGGEGYRAAKKPTMAPLFFFGTGGTNGTPHRGCTSRSTHGCGIPKAAVHRVDRLDAWKNVIQSSEEDQEGMGWKLSWAREKEG